LADRGHRVDTAVLPQDPDDRPVPIDARHDEGGAVRSPAWSQPGAATGMINYYRSSVRTSPKRAEAALRPISAPTLVIWGNAIAPSAQS
jgi:hypothetical protein